MLRCSALMCELSSPLDISLMDLEFFKKVEKKAKFSHMKQVGWLDATENKVWELSVVMEKREFGTLAEVKKRTTLNG